MLEFRISIVSIVLTFVLFVGGIEFESADLAFGQFFEDSGTNSSNFESNSTSENANAADIVLLSQKLKKASFGYRDLVGQVKNIGSESAESVNILLTVYDKNGGANLLPSSKVTHIKGLESTGEFYRSRLKMISIIQILLVSKYPLICL